MPDDTQNSASVKLAERFRGMAETLGRDIDHKRAPSTQNPTPRRIRMAEQAARDADRLEELQQCLIGMAGDLEKGTLPECLASLKNKVHIEGALSSGRRATQEDGTIVGLPERELTRYTALRAYITGPSAEDQASRRLQELESSLVGVKIPGFFPTPPEMVAELVKLARLDLLEFVARVLEPSAGKGDIADAIRAKGSDLRLECCEINHTLRKVLEEKGHSMVADDFLAYEPGQVYDLIVMNPPFEKGQDAEHVRHAFDLLKAGGRLVAIVSEGLFFREDRKATAFREWLELHGAEESERIQDAFKNGFRSTGVSVRIVTATKTERDVRLLDAERVDLDAVNPGWMSLARALGHEPKRDYYLEWYWKRRSEFAEAWPEAEWMGAAPGDEIDLHPPTFTAWLQTWNPKDKPTLDPRYEAPAEVVDGVDDADAEAEAVATEPEPGCKGCGRPVEKSWAMVGICHTCLNQQDGRIPTSMPAMDETPAEAAEVVQPVVSTQNETEAPDLEECPVQSEPDTMTAAAVEPDAPQTEKRVFRDIPLADIIPSPNNKRHLPDARSLELGCEILREYLEGDEVGAHNGLLEVAIWRDLYELAKSIRGQGLAQPGVARPAPDPDARAAGKVELCCGHRRLVAHRIAGLPTMLVGVRDLDDRQAAELTSVENLQRSDLTPLEEGEQIAVLLEKGWDVETVATHIGKTPSWVYRRAQVAKLTPEWREMLGAPGSRCADWSAGHLELMARLPETMQTELATAFSEDYWMFNSTKTVSDLHELIGRRLRTLESAPWKLDDAGLLPEAGACAMCPKRSGCQPMLFASDETDGKDTCLDAPCWKAKSDAHLIRRVAEVQDEYGDAITLGYPRWNGEQGQWTAAKAIEEHNGSPKKKKGSRPVLMVSGRHAGEILWFDQSRTGRKVDGDGNVKPLTLAERRQGLQHKRDAWAVTHVSELLIADDSEPRKYWDGAPLADMLALVAAFGTASSTQYLPAKEEYNYPRTWGALDIAATLDPYDAVLAVWKSIRHKLNETLAFDTQVTASLRVDAAKRVCDLLQVDWDAIMAKAEAECPEPKSWAKLNADGTPKTKKPQGKKRAAKAEKGEVA